MQFMVGADAPCSRASATMPLPPLFGRARLIAGEEQHLAEMPPRRSTQVGSSAKISAQQRHVARDLVPLAAFIADMMQRDVARADCPASSFRQTSSTPSCIFS